MQGVVGFTSRTMTLSPRGGGGEESATLEAALRQIKPFLSQNALRSRPPGTRGGEGVAERRDFLLFIYYSLA